ncbi:MAG: hypothetical protein ACOYBY_13680 [Dermatophilaceae bacterium]
MTHVPQRADQIPAIADGEAMRNTEAENAGPRGGTGTTASRARSP